MNLFRKQKFSIRKFNIGIFSALIATVAFLAHPGQATASELEPSQNNDTTAQSDGGLENTSQSNPISEETTNTLSGQTVPSSTENKQTQNVPNHNAQPIAINTEEAESAQTASYTNINENNDTSDDGLHVNQPAKHHIEAQSEDVTNHTNSNHSNSSIPENKATTESSSKPKKRGKRSLDTNSGNDTTSTTQNTDPNLSNTGPNGINTVITFDDLGIKTSTNRSRPEVKVVDSLNGFTMVNGGKVGLLNSVLERTSVFDSADPKNYQAIDNVVALGRIKGNDPNDHDGFNGIEKEFSVNPNSEIIFSFNTMTAKNRKGGTQLVLRNAENNQEIASTDIQGGGVYRLFKLPDNVHRLKVQFLPMNEIHSDFKRIQQLHDGYRYYSFIDTIGVNSGSHLYVKSRQVNKNVKNGKEFEVNTRIENNGNFAAAIGQNELTYKVTLPENFEYVDNSTEVSFVNGNVPNSTVNPFSVNFDRQNHTLTFSSNGLNLGRSAQDVARFLPNKILNIRYKLRPVNISTPREVTFNEAIKYKTFSEYYINTNDNTVTGQQTPFSINVIMNKDDLSEKVNKDIIPSNYTLASYNKYNKLKERAQTVLDEETNNTPFNQRYSQTQIDDLLHELQTTLINRVSASREINDKAQEMTDAVYDSTELTTEEKDTLVDQIENHKNEISNNIDDELTDDGVERVKEAGLHTLESDTSHPVTKPNARQVVNNRADQQKTLIRNNHEATTEEQNEAIRQVEAHSSDAIAKIGEAETDTTVNEARDNGTKLIATDVPNPTKKAEARAAVTNSANSKIKDINNNTQATLDERNDAIALVNRSKDEAIQNINTAQGNDDVTEAQNNGTNTIQQVPLTPVKRQNAIATINAKADEQKRLIQANNNATTEEKADAERKVNEAVITANQNITNATTNRDVDQAQTTGSGIISAISPATKIKEDARAAVEAKAIAQNQQINSNNMATTEEKEDALNQVEAHKQAAIATINQAQSTQQVSEAKNNGINTINQDQPNAVKKNNTKTILEQKGNEKKSAIAQTPDATTEEKQEAVSAVSQAVTNGITHINQVNSNDDVDQELSNAEQIITHTNVNVQKKPQARQALIAKTNEKQSAINSDNEGTIEEKQKAIQSLNDAKNLADEQITQAASNQNVDNALNIGISNISKIQTNFTKKQQARDQVNQKFQEKEAELNSTPHATQDEKQDALTRLTQAKETALNDINQAQTNQNVDTALTSGIQNIQNTQVNVRKKQEAKTTINDIVQQHKQTIQNNDDATTEEKEVANNLVNASQQNVISKIDNATTNNQIDGIVSDGRQSINAITPDTSIKRNAKNDIDIKAADKKIKIQRINDATDEEIQEANRKIEEAKIEAKDNIQRNSTRDQVNEAKTNGINKIENITPATTVKSEARQAVQNKANEQINHIQNTPDATNEEKQEAINRVSAELARVQAQINAEHTTQGVKTIKDDAITSLSRINAQVVEKESARNAIEQKATQQTQFINNNDNATDEEKEVANNLVIATKQKSLDNINSLSSNNDVENAKVEGINEIANVLPATAVKSKAKKDIDQKLAQQINQIQTHQTATTEEKEAAIQLANQKSNEARTAIQNEHSNNGVAQAKSNGIHEIELVMPDAHKKSDAKQSIDNKYNEQSNTINTTPDATDEEKQKALDKLKIAKDAGYNKVDQAQTNQQVSDAKTEAIDTITNIQANVAKKPSARVELDSKFEDLKRQINATPNATEEEKQDAIQRLNGKRDEVKNLINQDRRDNEVEQHKNIGLQELETIHANPTRKSDALQELQTKFISQTELINNNKDATNEEKDEAKRLLEISKNKTITNINQAQTNNQVDNAKDNGMNEIATIIPATTIKTDAKTAIDKKAEQQVTIINGNNDATDEEKAEARKLVEKAKIEAKSNITNSDTEREVNGAKTNGLEKINNIQPSTQTKTQAKADIAQAIGQQRSTIDQNQNATTEEKQEALERLNQETNGVNDRIQAALANQNVTDEKNNILETIRNVEPIVIVKPKANEIIRKKAAEQTTLINQNQDATLEEKAEANRLLQNVLTSTSDEIANVDHNNEVDQALDKARPKIEEIVPQVSKKRDVLNAIQEAFNSQTQEIQENQEATNEEKTEALNKINQLLNQAKVNIDQAQSNKDVDSAKTRSIQDIEQIQPHPQTKATGRHRLNEKANQQQSTIATHPNSTIEERQEASAKLQEVLKKAIAKIDKGQTNDDVEKTVVNGIAEIENILPATTVKDKAKADVNAEKEQKNLQINSNDEATTEEKLVASDNLNHVVETTNQAIEDAPDTNQVNVEKNKGIGTIRDIQPLVVKKPTAKSKIESAVEKKKTEINQTQNATHDEVREGLNQLNQIHEKAKNDVNQSQTNQQVENAEQNSLDQINNFRPDFSKKRNAVAEIVKAQQNKIDEIEQEFSATQEEKDNALQHLDEQVKEIINSINQANTDNEVDNAKTSGLNNITEYRPEYNKKKNAILKLYDVSDTQEAIINGYPDATEDELQEANSKLNKILLDAKKQIGLAHTNNEVDDIYNEVSQKMKTILPRVDTKAVARSVLNALAKQLIKTFENTADVTHEERNDAINHVKEQLSLVFNAIEKDRKDIQVAQDELFGLNELNSIFINITQKPTARKAISGMASQLNNSINNTPYATEEERQIALNKVKAIVDDANEKIREANTDSEVLGTKSNAITLLQAISADVQVKPQAFEEINAQAEIQRERINGNSDATREEKEEALKQVDTLVNHSFITINNVNKNQEVYDTKDKTIEAIHKIKPISTIKPQALNEITIQLDTQRDLIKNNKESTVEEKASAIDKLIKTAARIAEAIDKAQTNEEVKNIKKQSIDEISKILPVIEIKSAARNEIHQKAEVIRGLINDNEEATKEEKDIALNQLDTTLTQANVSIDQALTNEAVNRAKEIANSEINKISVIAIKKPEAIAEIQELADKKLNKFKQSQEATIEEKQSAINELEQALKSAINHIHQSQNNESVSAALKESISLIDSIEIQAHKKLEAKAYIDGYSDDKINDISSRATNEEKQIFVSKLKALINRTHKQIDEAETFVSVETIVRNFKVEADKLNSIVRKKAKASKEIELEADHVKQMINANLSASTRVKQNARTLINEIVSNALSQLNKVTTNKEVDEIVNETIEKLKSIQIREDKILSSQRSSTSMTEKSNQCYSSENNTIKSLPEAGNADKSLPLAGVTLISGLAIMSSRKKKKDKKVND
ncbi:SasC/FmtB family protein [Staphylococcus epidermidis]|uniref:SasC/FmtB family protein n=1 Tax=Staphylococcus epidermidis TaxID=1282 RepID=UPI0011A36189|nr:SasC/FmtB family protein [Staphylococcus epidermidis]